MITDRGTAFTSNSFKAYCQEENIQHLLIATGVPRRNGQVEIINRIVITVLSKLFTENPQNWYKHVDRVQQCINNTPSRSTKFSPFKILTGPDMKVKNLDNIRHIIEEETLVELDQEREQIRNVSKENLIKIEQGQKNINQVILSQLSVHNLGQD